ncbi:MAG: DUF5916 domain-containing protein [Bacteroidetes bacterium]|nr:DUF5916 domain-containing protein [Bacteroidota bacterium]
MNCRSGFLFLTFIFFLTGYYGMAGKPGSVSDSLFRARKTIRAERIREHPKIDGILDEPFWKTLPAATDFVEYSPRNGIVPPYPSVVRFAYDDQSLYISAVLYDPHPDSICKEMGRRDQVELLNTDYISFDILPYNDQMNMYEFKVTPLGLQNDCKYSAIGTDLTWDAVWTSAATITDSGWIAELEIPWSALRFPRVENQVWGINMWRNFQRKQNYSTWSFVDNTTNAIFKYYGDLVGISNIKPPVRLSFTPYLSGYVQKTPESKSWQSILRGGLDLRYGINESYTLDMMLIPDFGQVQSDDQILNLTPFEVRYNENRQFFTEATELFSKCEIFYTRRVGSTPKDFQAPYDSLKTNERVKKNPEETRIINATKISGRNSKGLGVGFFNAMTTNTWAELEDTVTGATRKIMTQPFTNYNVLVLDQNLKNHSYITLINTNYYSPDSRYSANVSGTEVKIYNAKNTFAVLGRLNVSQKYQYGSSPDLGHNYLFGIGKPSGHFQYEAYRYEADNRYDPNDMGFLTNNNEVINELKLMYQTVDPFWKILSTQSEFYLDYSTLYKPGNFTSLQLKADNMTNFTNFWANYLEVNYYPLGTHDYYEPRMWGWYYDKPMQYDFLWKIATDVRKKFRIHNTIGIMNAPDHKNFRYWIEMIPRIRLSNRFTISLTVHFEKNLNDYGWVDTQFDTLYQPLICFGRRDVTTINNILSAVYNFSTKASLNVRIRHYWSQADYLDFYTLNTDGKLTPGDYSMNPDINFNAFTADVQFTWNFAPGSELSVVWKNSITTQQGLLEDDYFNNFSNMISTPQSNSFSVRVLYYLDYLSLKKLFSKKKPEV